MIQSDGGESAGGECRQADAVVTTAAAAAAEAAAIKVKSLASSFDAPGGRYITASTLFYCTYFEDRVHPVFEQHACSLVTF